QHGSHNRVSGYASSRSDGIRLSHTRQYTVIVRTHSRHHLDSRSGGITRPHFEQTASLSPAILHLLNRRRNSTVTSGDGEHVSLGEPTLRFHFAELVSRCATYHGSRLNRAKTIPALYGSASRPKDYED